MTVDEVTPGLSAGNALYRYDFTLTNLTVMSPDIQKRAVTLLIWKEDGSGRCVLEFNNFSSAFLSFKMVAKGLEDNTIRLVLYSRSRIRNVVVCRGFYESLLAGEDRQLAANIHVGRPLSIGFNGSEEAVFTVEEKEVQEVGEDCDSLRYTDLSPLYCNVCRQVLYNDPELSHMSRCSNCDTVNALTAEASSQLRQKALIYLLVTLLCILSSILFAISIFLGKPFITSDVLGLTVNAVLGGLYGILAFQTYCMSRNIIAAVGVHERNTLGVLVNKDSDEETGRW